MTSLVNDDIVNEIRFGLVISVLLGGVHDPAHALATFGKKHGIAMKIITIPTISGLLCYNDVYQRAMVEAIEYDHLG